MEQMVEAVGDAEIFDIRGRSSSRLRQPRLQIPDKGCVGTDETRPETSVFLLLPTLEQKPVRSYWRATR